VDSSRFRALAPQHARELAPSKKLERIAHAWANERSGTIINVASI
jgi:hypothetical protein